MSEKKRILIVAAHPDDEILGCGGTIARLVLEGYEAYTLILGEGATARDEQREPDKRSNEIITLKTQMKKANNIIGVKEVFSENLPDNRFDTVPLLDIVKIIESIKEEISPDIVFTHYRNDLNIDHKITNQAVITATRPLPNETVREIYAFEVLSSTEWNYPLTYQPDTFYDISNTLKYKLLAIKEYYNELRDFPHPRSLKAIKMKAEFDGVRVGLSMVESFKLIRSVR